MSTANEEVVRRYYDEMVNERKLGLAAELFTDDHKFHDPHSPDVSGPDEMAAMVSAYLEGWDAYFRIKDVIVAGDKVTVRLTGAGRHSGELFGIPPTGVQAEVDAISIHRLEGGKIAETWHMWDTFGFLQQTGVTPQQWQVAITSRR